MRRIDSIRELQAFADAERAAGHRIALVPTMGALHEGHLALVAEARRRAERVIVSIFVNPTQFNDPRDLAAYPRTLEADLEACRGAGVDVVFAPEASELYPDGAQTHVEVSELARDGMAAMMRNARANMAMMRHGPRAGVGPNVAPAAPHTPSSNEHAH